VLVTYAPAGFEGFYRELPEGFGAGKGESLERCVATAARYGCEITGPHPSNMQIALLDKAQRLG
jgi:hypothetical protein